MNTFLKSQFEVQGTEVESTNIYADIRQKTLQFAVCNDFDVDAYARKHNMVLKDVLELDGRIDTYTTTKGNYKYYLTLEYKNELPNMVHITYYYADNK